MPVAVILALLGLGGLGGLWWLKRQPAGPPPPPSPRAPLAPPPSSAIAPRSPAQVPVPVPSAPDAALRVLARLVAEDLKANLGHADVQRIKMFQQNAGLVPDGIYGPKTRGALVYYGAENPIPPLTSDKSTTPYTPRR